MMPPGLALFFPLDLLSVSAAGILALLALRSWGRQPRAAVGILALVLYVALFGLVFALLPLLLWERARTDNAFLGTVFLGLVVVSLGGILALGRLAAYGRLPWGVASAALVVWLLANTAQVAMVLWLSANPPDRPSGPPAGPPPAVTPEFLVQVALSMVPSLTAPLGGLLGIVGVPAMLRAEASRPETQAAVLPALGLAVGGAATGAVFIAVHNPLDLVSSLSGFDIVVVGIVLGFAMLAVGSRIGPEG